MSKKLAVFVCCTSLASSLLLSGCRPSEKGPEDESFPPQVKDWKLYDWVSVDMDARGDVSAINAGGLSMKEPGVVGYWERRTLKSPVKTAAGMVHAIAYFHQIDCQSNVWTRSPVALYLDANRQVIAEEPNSASGFTQAAPLPNGKNQAAAQLVCRLAAADNANDKDVILKQWQEYQATQPLSKLKNP
jgi:hypothetical protein